MVMRMIQDIRVFGLTIDSEWNVKHSNGSRNAHSSYISQEYAHSSYTLQEYPSMFDFSHICIIIYYYFSFYLI